MPIDVAHLKTVLTAKGYQHDALLDIWVSPAGDWYHLYPDGLLGRLNPEPFTENDPRPRHADSRLAHPAGNP